MKFKIDTREKFTIITPDSDFSSDNLTAEFKELVHSFLQHKTNLVINLKNIVNIKENSVSDLAALQNEFYEHNISFVLCEMQLPLLNTIKKLELDEVLNITPTETEAWDIVQMEEVERELLGDE
ncbi:MAG: anti-anti-sigma factor [Parafilimonas sp.]|nr:anti-anti-sigma factor [Parafilimonas sp.]